MPDRPSSPLPDPGAASETCPGCGAVLASLPDVAPAHPGASASCARLFEVTLRGLREEARTDRTVAPLVHLADAAYDAQHPVPGDPARTHAALARLAELLGTRPTRFAGFPVPPGAWRITVSDAAADLDVIDLPVLVESWARAVHGDWAATPGAGT